MTIKVAINGYGRIGRNILRAHYEGNKMHDIQIVAINDLGPVETNAHLTRYDTAHGKFPGTVAVEGDSMVVNGDKIRVLAQRDPAQLPWGELGVDVVLECTGFFTSKEKASAHLRGGAKKVVISAPGGKDVDATVVFGVNHNILKSSDTVISNASCTTNCAAPMILGVLEACGIEEVSVGGCAAGQVADVGHRDADGLPDPCHLRDPVDVSNGCPGGRIVHWPVNWEEPLWLWFGPEEQAPVCPEGSTTYEGHADLVALPDVAHVGFAAVAHRAPRQLAEQRPTNGVQRC